MTRFGGGTGIPIARPLLGGNDMNATTVAQENAPVRLGEIDEARTHLRLAVALSPTTKIYAGALSRLGPKPG